MRRLAILLGLAAVIAGAIGALGVSHAQYPSPLGSVTLSADEAVLSAGGNTALTAELKGRDGFPVGGELVFFTIVAEPGHDASFDAKQAARMTDASGRATATLNVGSTPGVIVIKVQAGELASNVIVNAMPAAAAAPATAPRPPAAPVEITPPSTGSAGLAAD